MTQMINAQELLEWLDKRYERYLVDRRSASLQIDKIQYVTLATEMLEIKNHVNQQLAEQEKEDDIRSLPPGARHIYLDVYKAEFFPLLNALNDYLDTRHPVET